jgi:hypothetical protein
MFRGFRQGAIQSQTGLDANHHQVDGVRQSEEQLFVTPSGDQAKDKIGQKQTSASEQHDAGDGLLGEIAGQEDGTATQEETRGQATDLGRQEYGGGVFGT